VLPSLGLRDTDRFSAAAQLGAPVPNEADLRWWRQFDDPALGNWVEQALAGNLDIAIAAERVAQARALLQLAQARRGPSLGLGGDLRLRLRGDDDQRRLQPGAALAFDFDTDLWGGLRQAERSAAAGVLRSQDQAAGARLAAAGLAARAYLEWRTALQDHQLLEGALALQREALRVVTVRVDAGLSPVLDRERAQAEVSATEAERAGAAVRSGQALAALQVLAGQRPAPGMLRLESPAQPAVSHRLPLPALTGAQPLVRPVDLLRLRPDVRAAEQALVVAAAEIGVAEAALRPQLRLPGSLVFGAAMGGGMFQLVGATLATALDLTLFDGGAAAAGVDGARSVSREAALRYRQTLLEALRQVESALVAQQGASARITARQRASAAALAAEEQAQTLYRVGLTGFLELVDAQRTAIANQRALVQAQADAASASVAVFEAMGLIDAP
jgi:NodT family efflux transporter outer membrane factor (OMF) lipoprotein